MPDSRTLVDHTFRHEYGRLVSLLTRSLGIAHLELVEDVVQSALEKAIKSWGQKGVPDDPSGWLYRTARNLAIDTLRRDQIEKRYVEAASIDPDSKMVEQNGLIDFEEVGDEPLRLLILCCHPAIPFESQIAFALRTVSGFSSEEVANALLISKANAEKRFTRAKEKLREFGTEIAELDTQAIESRIETVQSTIYLLFSEGYSSSSGNAVLRADLCEEAIRLARMLVKTIPTATHASGALLAMMLMHAARFDARFDTQGAIVLLKDQDRSRWRWEQVREAMEWMIYATKGDQLTRYHVEAAIAWEHCRASSFDEVDWSKIVEYYQVLERIAPGPMAKMNRAIALSYAQGAEVGLRGLSDIATEDRARLRPWWDCAVAEVYYRLGMQSEAISHWEDALALASNQAQRALLEKRLLQFRSGTSEDRSAASSDSTRSEQSKGPEREISKDEE